MPTFVRTQEIDHEIGERGQLGLRVTAPEAEIRAIDGGTAHVGATFKIWAGSEAEADEIFEGISLRVSRGAGVLELTEPKEGLGGLGSLKRRLFSGSGKTDLHLQIEAPRSADLRYEGVSGDLTAIGFDGSQRYRTVSGDVVLDSVGGELRLKGVSGDVSIRADAPLSTLEMETVSGDASVLAPHVGHARIVTVSGDVELETSLGAGAAHRVETVSGDLSLGVAGDLTLEVRGLSTDVDIRLPHRAEGSRDRRRYVIGQGGPSFLFSSMSGDVEIHEPRRGIVAPTPPTAPTLPTPPTPHTPPRMVVISEDEQLEVLRALERGEIDIEEATRRLAGEHAPDD
jgi:Putative adhesin